jgi:anti-sigma B factor antagonist
MPGDAIRVDMLEREGAIVLSPKGEIGYQEAPGFRTYIRAAYDKKPARVVADLSSVSYMGTPGVATLVEALQISKRTQTPLVLCGMSERVRAIFEIARLQTVFKIVTDVDTAMKA